MVRIPSAHAVGYSGVRAELLHATEYVVLTPFRMVVVDEDSDMLDDVVRLLHESGEIAIAVFKREGKMHVG